MKEEKQAININTLISEKSIKRNTNVRLLETRLFSLNRFIAKKREKNDFTNEVLALRREQMEILGKLRKLDPSYTLNVNKGPVYFNKSKQFRPPPPSSSPTTFIDGSTFFFGWYEGCLETPEIPDEGVSIVPSGSGISGEIETMESGRGFHGRLVDDENTLPEHYKVWLKNWKYVIPIPPPPNESLIRYSLTIYARWNMDIERYPAFAQVMSYVSVGQESDFTPDKTIDVDTSAGWPVIHDLHEPVEPFNQQLKGLLDTPHEEYDGHRGEVWGNVTIEGTMRVKGHATAAIAVLVGAVGCLADGQFKIFDSAYYLSKEKRYVGTSIEDLIANRFKMCYRVEPILRMHRRI